MAFQMDPTPHETPAFRPGSGWLTGGLAVLDAEGRVVSVNEPLASWLDETPETLTGREWLAVLAHKCPDWESGVRAWIESESQFRTTDLPGHPDQPDGWIRLTGGRGRPCGPRAGCSSDSRAPGSMCPDRPSPNGGSVRPPGATPWPPSPWAWPMISGTSSPASMPWPRRSSRSRAPTNPCARVST
ncbi:MAG: hypothetical protein EBU81_10400 [Proteobacteria bacterium]|nr:hypothetical protein [Pseudomonadota bacterium]